MKLWIEQRNESSKRKWNNHLCEESKKTENKIHCPTNKVVTKTIIEMKIREHQVTTEWTVFLNGTIKRMKSILRH